MTTPAAPGLDEIDLFLQGKDGPQYEYVDGKLEERTVSTNSSRTAVRILRILGNHVEPTGLGDLYESELGIRIFSDPIETRRADLSFVSAGRSPRHDSGYLRVAPELVVEVVSPGDVASRLRGKVSAWLDEGVKLVWVAYPEEREIHVFRSSGGASILAAEEQISGEDVLPGFAVTVRDLFPA